MQQKLSVFQTNISNLNGRLIEACELAISTQETLKYRDGTVQTQGHLRDVIVEDNSLVEVHTLYSVIGDAIKAFRPDKKIDQLWLFANRSPKSIESNVFHDHPGYDIAGCYYVQVPLGSGGNLEFTEPSLTIHPEEGMLVLFEADYWHRVTDVSSEDLYRYSIAFNCKFA